MPLQLGQAKPGRTQRRRPRHRSPPLPLPPPHVEPLMLLLHALPAAGGWKHSPEGTASQALVTRAAVGLDDGRAPTVARRACQLPSQQVTCPASKSYARRASKARRPTLLARSCADSPARAHT